MFRTINNKITKAEGERLTYLWVISSGGWVLKIRCNGRRDERPFVPTFRENDGGLHSGAGGKLRFYAPVLTLLRLRVSAASSVGTVTTPLR